MNTTYTVNRSRKRKKTISLHIRNEADIVVSAPYFTPADEIRHFVEEKKNWINKTIQKQKDDSLKNKAKTYETGENFLYLGQEYPLDVFFEPFENAGITFRNNQFYLNAREGKDLRKYYFVSWYKSQAYDLIRRRVDLYSKRFNLSYKGIKITSAQSRWGSCSEDDRLTFSFRLIMAPPDIIDYVIVHELMHIREKNHSPSFWQQVEAVMPEYEKHRRWLKDNRHQFIL
jgi:hypothetical protein